jgi:peroxin-13
LNSALTSLAEQFGNLRDTLGSIFGIYAVMRYIRVAIAKLRGRPLPPEDADISAESFNDFNDPNSPSPPPRSSKKPLIIFLLAVFGLPYLMGKLIRAMAHSRPHTLSSTPFDPSSAQFYRAMFDFVPQNPASEIPLRKGDVVAIVERTDAGWWRARLGDGREGYVPSTYLESVHNPSKPVPIMSPPGEKGHAFIEEFNDK